MRNIRTPAGSDVTEHQELAEIGELLLLVEDRLDSGLLNDAKALASEALEIDSTYVATLTALVDINIKLQRYEEAFYHAEYLIDLHPDDSLGPLMKAKVDYELKHYRDCINSSLKCLGMGYSQPKEATELIVKAVQGILTLPEDFTSSLQDMDFYSQLGEVGIVLLSAKQMVLVIQILEVALQLQTNQYGVSMRIHLTQGHAFCATQQYNLALKSYESCLSMSLSAHDISHQTKALVNIAALHISQDKTYKALVVYEKLLDLHSRLLADSEVCEDVWTDDFISGLYMNASIAYRAIGDLDKALHYAHKYLNGITHADDYTGLSLIHRHIGSLYETVGHYSMALSHYQRYLAMAKCLDDELEIALAYGHLGAIFGLIGLWKISLVYHDRHVSAASNALNSVHNTDTESVDHIRERSSEARKAAVQAYEMYGDTLMRKADYERAGVMYMSMSKYCDRGPLNRCRALYKTASTHLNLGNSQHALHFYDQALSLCDNEFTQLLEDIKFGIALSMQSALTSAELENAKKYFQQCIESLKVRIDECLEHHKFLPNELVSRLDKGFKGIQMVLAKLGCDLECLEYAEESRIFAARLTSQGAPFSRLPQRLDSSAITRIVSGQGASVIYYSFLDSTLLIWMLTQNKGLARFYVKKPQNTRGNVQVELQAMLSPWLRKLNKHYKKNVYKCEQRNVERKASTQPSSSIEKHIKCQVLQRTSSWSKSEKAVLENDENANNAGNSQSGTENADSEDEAQIERKLYKFLLSPFDDILAKIPRNSHVIIVPDQEICQVPFSRIRDLKGRPLSDRFNITYFSGIYSLKLVVENQISNLQQEDSVNFRRAQSCLGGCYRYLNAPEFRYSSEQDLSLGCNESVNRRRVGNPRLDVILKSTDYKAPSAKRPQERLEEDNTRRLQCKSYSVTGQLVQLVTDNEPLQRSRTFHQEATHNLYSLPRPISPRHNRHNTRAKTVSVNPVPQPCYHTPLDGCGNVMSMCNLLRTDNLSTLISHSSTGTDALTSTTAITEYSQISNEENFVAIGNPYLSSSMKLGASSLVVTEAHAYKLMKGELEAVSGILGCDYVFDRQATKDKFLEMASKATVIHIVTQVSLCEGFLVMSCSNDKLTSCDAIEERYYLVTVDDITKIKMRARLVVISGGWSIKNLNANQSSLQTLPNAFILAGAESVLTLPHPQTSESMNRFYWLFYTAFQQNSDVCTALNRATSKVCREFELPLFPTYLYGNNVNIAITEVKSAMLDQNIDEIESAMIENNPAPPLNEPLPEEVPSLEEQLDKLQMYLGEICKENEESIEDIAASLIQLAKDAGTIVQYSLLQVPNLVVLPTCLTSYPPAIHLLKLLRFGFEPRGMTQKQCEPAVLFPSWDPDGLLHRTSACLQTILDIKEKSLHVAIHDLLPIDQPKISNFIDVLALAFHSANIELNVSDHSLQNLWRDSRCRNLLRRVGFHQIGTILHFNSTRHSQKTLRAMLSLFIMISESKPETLLTELDMSVFCGGAQSQQAAGDEKESGQLPTILPILLPNDKLLRRVPWASRIERVDEMKRKKLIVERCWRNDDHFNSERTKLQQLQLSTAHVQAQELLSQHALPRQRPARVKVQSGSTASYNRVPVGYVPPLTSTQLEQRRKYSDFLRKTRLHELAVRERHENKRLLRSYTNLIH